MTGRFRALVAAAIVIVSVAGVSMLASDRQLVDGENRVSPVIAPSWH